MGAGYVHKGLRMGYVAVFMDRELMATCCDRIIYTSREEADHHGRKMIGFEYLGASTISITETEAPDQLALVKDWRKAVTYDLPEGGGE